VNDIESGYRICTECYQLLTSNESVCPRCRSKIKTRKPYSIQRTLALSIAALILYIPANIYPIMIIEKFHHLNPSTIIGGIIELYQQGMYFIGTVVFLASISIPLMKILVLFYLVYRTNHPSTDNRVNTWLFHLLEFIGKWSMLDIYVITIFISLVNLGFFTKVTTGPAAIYFTLVVFLTLLASHSFDSRLLWDNAKQKEHYE
jgi:paraquat-inducible protein A